MDGKKLLNFIMVILERYLRLSSSQLMEKDSKHWLLKAQVISGDKFWKLNEFAKSYIICIEKEVTKKVYNNVINLINSTYENAYYIYEF